MFSMFLFAVFGDTVELELVDELELELELDLRVELELELDDAEVVGCWAGETPGPGPRGPSGPRGSSAIGMVGACTRTRELSSFS